MQIRTILATAMLAFAALPAFAINAAVPLTFNSAGNASFSSTVSGVFDNAFSFTVGTSGGTMAVSAPKVSIDFGAITQFAGTLAGTALALQTSTVNGATVQTLVGAASALAPGVYTLHITGNAGAGASYGGNLIATAATVAAVPEPESYALMLGGLAAVGFLASRRNGMR